MSNNPTIKYLVISSDGKVTPKIVKSAKSVVSKYNKEVEPPAWISGNGFLLVKSDLIQASFDNNSVFV